MTHVHDLGLQQRLNDEDQTLKSNRNATCFQVAVGNGLPTWAANVIAADLGLSLNGFVNEIDCGPDSEKLFIGQLQRS